MNRNIAEITRTLLMITVMVASALMPMAPAADELRDSHAKMHAVSLDTTALSIDEGEADYYEIVLDVAPDGVLVITPSSNNADISVEPVYLKFTKINFDEPQMVKVITQEDDDGADTMAAISHALSGSDTVYASASVADVYVTGVDLDTDTDGDGSHDGLDDDDDGDGINDDAEEDGCDLLADCDGDGTDDASDEFPTDGTEDTDTDGDGTGDNGDAFPNDATEDTDSDGDGTGDNSDWDSSDANEDTDSDGDGVGDNADTDDDDDTVLDVDEESNSTLDCSVSTDCDGDGYGDADDAFDLDPEAWDDTDGDGLADTFPNLLVQDSGNYGCDLPDSPSSWTLISCTFNLPDEGLDLVITLDFDTWGYEAGMDVTHPDGTVDSYSFDSSYNNQIATLTITAAEAGIWQIDITDSFGDGGTATTAAYGDYTVGESWLGTMIVPATSGYGTSLDNDDDGDGFDDADEDTCGTDSLNSTDAPTDTDGDGACDAGVDDDDDNDGVDDADEEAGCELVADCDGDGVGDATDSHDNDATETSDMDGDGIGDNSDTDMDGDGYLDDGYDAFPEDGTEWADNDGDGMGDNSDANDDTCDTVADTDSDSDGVADTAECGTFGGLGPLGYDTGDSYDDIDEDFPNDPNQQFDVDGDGWGNNADADDDGDGIDDVFDDDDDGDGYSDADEDTNCVGDGGNSLTDTVTPDDMDGDGTCDYLDTDRDGDGTDNSADAFEDDACADTDTDGDGDPDTIVAGCTTTLTEDGDDDFDASNVQVAWTITSESYSTMDVEIYVDDVLQCTLSTYYSGYSWGTESTPCSVTAGEIEIYMDYCSYYCGNYGDSTDTYIVVSVGGSVVETLTQENTVNWYILYPGTVDTLSAADYVSGVWTDADETTCGTDPLDAGDTPTDTDGDNLCDDIQDSDNDDDGWTNDEESTDCGESNDPLDDTDMPTDTDADGVCNGLDDDDDDDGVDDADDAFPLDDAEWDDSDGDGTGDNSDTDADNDGVDDADDAFPADVCADTDTDGDGMPDDITFGCTTTLTVDDDDDGDGFSDDDEYTCGSHRWNAAKTPTDTDGDGLCDNGVDDDDDGDGVDDADEADGSGIPADCLVTVDCDGDGVDDADEADGSGLSPAVECAASTDCDGDGTGDGSDAFPVDASEDTDTDGDGIGDNTDGDADGDGLNNDYDECPLDASGTTDNDGDGTCDETDADDDNDGVDDADDCDPYDADETSDNDGDGICDNADADDDGDGADDADDECPLDASGTTDTDGDGTCDDTDTDDDGDGVDDADEEAGCSLLSDCDGDGTADANDAFDNDADADTDTDGDGAADDFGSIDTSNTAFTIDTQSNGAMTIYVYDGASGDELCSLTTNAGGLYDAGTDAANASDSCTVTAGSINLVADGTAYYTYYGAVFGYWVPNVNVSIGGTSVAAINAEYQWYYDNFFGNPFDIATVNPYSSAGTPLDLDDDNDGYSDNDESTNCGEGNDPLDATDSPSDNDGDFVCDALDADDDNDGYSDDDESNNCEGTDPMDAADEPADNDGDGICDVADSDDDNDGTADADDWAPFDSYEDTDTDNDGTGNNADSDDDGDGVADSDDAEPTDRCSSYDEDGDGLVNDFQECSTLGFYSTINADEGNNAGAGLSDGDWIGITDSTSLFGGAAEGDQWFQIEDTDGVFRIYFDHAVGVSYVSVALGIASTSWDSDDYLAAYWADDSGTTYTLQDSRWHLDGDLDSWPYEGLWATWTTHIPASASGDGYIIAEFSSDSGSEVFGLDSVAYLDSSMGVIAATGFEDQTDNTGGYYTTPSDPVTGTYTIEVFDSYGDGGHSITASLGGMTLCSISGSDYSTYDSCTFEATDLATATLEVAVDTDSWPYEGSMDITMPDGSVVSETWTADTTFSYAHSGEVQLDLWGDYLVEVYDSYGDGGHGIDVSWDGTSVCSIGQYDYSSYDSCTFSATSFTSATMTVDVNTDSWPSEGSMSITLPDGSFFTEYWSGDTSFTYTITPSAPPAGEVMLSNGWGSTVSIDVSSYMQGTLDDDDDNDGVPDVDDAFPLDADEHDDYDGDGIGSNADDDDDGDGVADVHDAFPRHSQAWDDYDGDGMPDVIEWVSGEVSDGFESGGFSGFDDASANGWERSGDQNWGLAMDAMWEDYAARAGIVSDSESTTLEVSIYTESGFVSFDYYISTEERYDNLCFSVDGIEEFCDSGQTPKESHAQVNDDEFICTTEGAYGESFIPLTWVDDGYDDCGDTDGDGAADDEDTSSVWTFTAGTVEVWVDEGNHTLSWTYAKDDSASAGLDRAYVDNVVIPYWVQGEGECEGTDDYCNIEDLDDDNDGTADVDDPCPLDEWENIDTDGDGWCDNADADDDNDGVYDYNDGFPLDENETTDNDGDGIGDNADPDDDNDGCDDDEDDLPLDGSDCTDTDGDGLGDNTDPDDDGDNVDDLNDAFPEDGSAWQDNDGDGIPDFNGDPPFMGNFEGGAIPSGWTTFGDAEWFVQSNTVINGSFSAQSGDINDAETSSLELSIDTLAGPYSFAYYTDTESNWDYLRFYLDGSLVNSWTGPANGGSHSGTLSAGYHTFEWMYYKDFSVSSYTDTVWIDDVSLPISQTMYNNDTDDDNDGVHDDYDLDPIDPCINVDTDGDGAPDTVATGLFDMSEGADPGNFTVDCDMSPWFEDWDDDGDGWSDDLEEDCGSDSLDAEHAPPDGDGDWICNDMDGDWDNDGYANVDYSCDPVWEGLSCFLDEFNFVDKSDDGEVDIDEFHFFYSVLMANDYGDDDYEELTYVCGDGSEVPFDWVNDGMVDCEDGSDEQQYDDTGNKTNWFDCFDGSQVWMDQVNDGVADCADGEDEGEMEGDGSDDGYGAPDDEFNDTVWAEILEDDSDGNGAISWDEYWDLLVDDGQIASGATNPGWPGDGDVWDMFPLDPSEAFDNDGDGLGDNSDPDDDNDGVSDSMDEFPYDPTEWNDLDGDGIGDNADDDTDGDGTPDDLDQFDNDPEASADNDGDGADDASDTDDDNDGVPDVSDAFPNDATEWIDTDGDGIGNNADTDDDNDGELDFEDALPLNPVETSDNDGDGIGDGSDPDDDNDGIPDGLDAFPMDPNESRDLDNDGIGDNADPDMDEDGVANADDAFPLNSEEWADTDGDNIGDNADTDQDGDGDLNADDPWPLDDTEWDDTDGDGIGDNADTDDDGDGYTDADEAACGTDSKLLSSTPSDFDGDGDCDAIDTSDSRSEAAKGENAQPELGFTPGFPSMLAAISLLGAAMLGRRKDD